ncbi:MAG TPA: PadR family transcriptional regulator [Conexibacter sp.]|nr:PadR family transcriptional regulator [Conexibacter sp.]
MRVGTKHAVLGLLLEQPSYGYEVLVRFRRAFDAAQWGISPQGLYASLDRLERDGLIELVETPARDASRRQPKTPYRVTPSGAQELQRFLEAPMSADPSRAELLVRLQCVGARDAEALVQMLNGHEQACLDELGRIGGEASGQEPGAGPSLIERLALEERRLAIQARLLWIDYARHELRASDGADRRAEVQTR